MGKTYLVASTALLCLGVTNAHAQSIDYGSLESLFGEPVTTSATGKPQRASDAPASMIIIDRGAIERSGTSSIPGILRRYAGIDVNQWTASGQDVTIRGGVTSFNPGLLVLVDGRQAYLDHYGYTDWEALGIQIEEVQQIEVVKGPNSALFGFNAAVGVVNIITINPLKEEKSVVVAEGGNAAYARVSGVHTFRSGDRFAARVSAGYQVQDEFEELPEEAAPLLDAYRGDPRTESFSVDAYFKLSDQTILNLETTYTDSEKHSVVPFSNGLDYSEVTTQSYRANLQHEGFGGLLKAQAYLNDLETTIALVTIDQSTFVAQLEHVFKGGTQNAFRLMGEYRHNYFETVDAEQPGISINLAGKVGYDVFALGGMWERRVSDDLTFTGAVRVDHLAVFQDGEIAPESDFTASDFDQSFAAFSYNAGLVWKKGPLDKVRLVAARGSQSPSLVSLGVNNVFPSASTPGLLVSIPGDPTIEPSPVDSYEVAYVRSLPSINGSLETIAYYTDRQDLILWPGALPSSLPPQSSFVTFQQFQDGDYQTYGLETSLKGRRDGGAVWEINYTYTEVEEDIPGQTDPTTGFNLLPAAFEDMTPTHKANASASTALGKLRIDGLVRYRSETSIPLGLGFGFPYTTNEDIGASVTADVQATYPFVNGIEVYTAADNLFDNKDAGGSHIANEIRARIGLRARF